MGLFEEENQCIKVVPSSYQTYIKKFPSEAKALQLDFMDFIERSLSRQIAKQFQLLLCVLNKVLSKAPLQTFKRKAELEAVDFPSCSGGGSGDTAVEECQLEFK